MQPETPLAPQNRPTIGASSTDLPSKSKKRALILVAVGLLILLLFGVLWISKTNSDDTNDNQGVSGLTSLSVGDFLYAYACTMATEEEAMRIFGLTSDAVGSITQTSALAAKDVAAETNDLLQLAPADTPYNSECSYSMAKPNAAKTNQIDVRIAQYATPDKAAVAYKTIRMTSTGDLTDDGVDNGTRKIDVLPGFKDASVVRIPDTNAPSPIVTATYLTNNKVITISYRYNSPDRYTRVLPQLSDFVESINSKLRQPQTAAPLSLTGRQTFVGAPLVDICQEAALMEVADIFQGITVRPDEATSIQTYAALPGSFAAEDGAGSSCTFNYNTEGDRQAIQETAPNADPDARWPHRLTYRTAMHQDEDKAKRWYDALKLRASQSSSAADSPLRLEDISSIGNEAYYVTFKQTVNASGEVDRGTTVTDEELVVRKGHNVFIISIDQVGRTSSYKTEPLRSSKDQLQLLYNLIQKTVDR